MDLLDRPLLLGLVALEREAVSATDLVEAFRAWRSNPRVSLGDILEAQGKLSRDRAAALKQWAASSLGDSADGGATLDAFPTEGAQTGSFSRAPRAPTTRRRLEETSAEGTQAATTLHSPSPGMTGPADRRTSSPAAPLRFRLLKLHASGGLGHVFEAEDTELKRRVALKEMQGSHADDAGSRRRFVAEAEITGNLEHPGIVPVYGLGVYADGRPFYAMRFIEGQTLSQAIRDFHAQGSDFASLAFRRLLARLVAAANAVAFAHSRGIVHRDLKPQNVMLGRFGETLVVDWGLAKAIASGADPAGGELAARLPDLQASDPDDATATGEVIGTPAYMSPEQAAGRNSDVGPPSDIYGLGAMLFAILTARAPATGSVSDVLAVVAAGQVSDARAIQPRAPRALAAICSQAMARLPGDRYASALDLAADLERWLADEPVTAYREPWLDRAFRFVRKHRLIVAVASAVLLAALVALGIGYGLVKKERDVAQASAATARDVVDSFLIQIGDNRWSQMPGFEEVRLNMVQLALARYGELLVQQPHDAALRADTARAHRYCGNLYRMMGQHAAAQHHYDAAATELRQLTALDASPDEPQRQLCGVLCDQAELIAKVQGPQAAEGPMRAALAIAKDLVERSSTTANRQTEARVEGNLAVILTDLGRIDEAIPLARQAKLVHEAAADANPHSAINRISAAFFAVSFAAVLRESERHGEAARVLAQSHERIRQYLHLDPRDTNLRYVLAWAKLEGWLLEKADGAGSEAGAELLAEAIAELNQLTEEFPRISSFQRQLATALMEDTNRRRTINDLELASQASARSLRILLRLDRQENSPANLQPLLTAAYVAQAEVQSSSGGHDAARASFVAARAYLAKARESQSAAPRLDELRRRIDAALQSAE